MHSFPPLCRDLTHKLHHTGPLWGESTSFLQKGSIVGSYFGVVIVKKDQKIKLLNNRGSFWWYETPKPSYDVQLCSPVWHQAITYKPMLNYCQLDLQSHPSVKLESKYINFRTWKCIWKCHRQTSVMLFVSKCCHSWRFIGRKSMNIDFLKCLTVCKALWANDGVQHMAKVIYQTEAPFTNMDKL